nr:hypothetical protein [Tanacetum cinerariifolium]
MQFHIQYWELYAPKLNLILADVYEYVLSDSVTSVPVKTSEIKPKPSKSVSKDIYNDVMESPDAPLADCNYHQRERVLYGNNYTRGHSQKEDQGYVDSECSRHMTGNMSYLSNFKEFDGGYVTIREEPKEG